MRCTEIIQFIYHLHWNISSWHSRICYNIAYKKNTAFYNSKIYYHQNVGYEWQYWYNNSRISSNASSFSSAWRVVAKNAFQDKKLLSLIIASVMEYKSFFSDIDECILDTVFTILVWIILKRNYWNVSKNVSFNICNGFISVSAINDHALASYKDFTFNTDDIFHKIYPSK